MHTMRIFVFALAALLLVAGIAGAGAALQAEPSAVAVVDVQQVFSSLKERTQLEADIQGRAEQLQQQAEDKENQIQQLQQELQVLNPGSEAHEHKQDEYGEAVMHFQVWTRFEQRKLQVEHALQLERLYRRTREAVAKIADERGYDIVLYKEQPLELDRQNLELDQVRSQIAIRKVLYASDDADITDRVVQRMNNEYESGE
ncbi:MAG: OmpH family outer membrane protein [Phycisphaeraceae bacterium]